MSRIGKLEITIPQGTDVSVDDGVVRVKGKLGELSREVRDEVAITIADSVVTVTPVRENKLARALWGTYVSHVQNMVRGVNEPFVKKLLVEGVGYKVSLSGKTLTLSVGFSHPVIVPVPDDITVEVEKNMITISGIDKEHVGQFAADIRTIKIPEPYKGKGIRYENEVVRRKQGKKVVS